MKLEILPTPIIEAEYDEQFFQNPIFKDFHECLNNNVKTGLDLLYQNIKTLKMKRFSKEQVNDKASLAEYSVVYNTILYNPERFKIAIMHELLHMSSSILTENCQFSGFSQFQQDGYVLIGIGLNEGYTALLDDRYFMDYTPDKRVYLNDSYMILKQLAGMLEDLLGHDFVEACYFHADLKGLIDCLCQFASYNDSICFILALDNIYTYCDSGKELRPRIAMENYSYAVEFIGKCYIAIFTEMLYKGEITEAKYAELMGYVYTIMRKQLRFKDQLVIGCRRMGKHQFKKILKDEQKKAIKKYT